MIQLKPGDHFFYRQEDYLDDLEFVCLDIRNGIGGGKSCYSITANPLPTQMPFNNRDDNKWAESTLNLYLNTQFTQRLGIVNMSSQNNFAIIMSPGCAGYVSVLSLEEYIKYKDIVPRYPHSWWLCSEDEFDTHLALGVCSHVNADTYPVKTNLSVFPVCAFRYDDKINFTKEDDKIIIQYTNS